MRETEGRRMDEDEGENGHAIKGKGNKELCKDGGWNGDGIGETRNVSSEMLSNMR